jgi:hypothetical protein
MEKDMFEHDNVLVCTDFVQFPRNVHLSGTCTIQHACLRNHLRFTARLLPFHPTLVMSFAADDLDGLELQQPPRGPTFTFRTMPEKLSKAKQKQWRTREKEESAEAYGKLARSVQVCVVLCCVCSSLAHHKI